MLQLYLNICFFDPSLFLNPLARTQASTKQKFRCKAKINHLYYLPILPTYILLFIWVFFQELNDHLNEKLRNFKLQVEDAEEIAALNLAKFRRAQTEVEESEQRANLAEQAMGKLRARSAMRSETPVSNSQWGSFLFKVAFI